MRLLSTSFVTGLLFFFFSFTSFNKISTINHIWNAVNINNEWLHLDLTWDDPVTDTNENVLLDDFFLISNNKLVGKNTKQHNYDINIYKEIANH